MCPRRRNTLQLRFVSSLWMIFTLQLLVHTHTHTLAFEQLFSHQLSPFGHTQISAPPMFLCGLRLLKTTAYIYQQRWRHLLSIPLASRRWDNTRCSQPQCLCTCKATCKATPWSCSGLTLSSDDPDLGLQGGVHLPYFDVCDD